MNPTENKPAARLRPAAYWRLWVLDTALVTAGLLFCLATNYGTAEFPGRAAAMALLPCIPLLVLVGGAGSTIFALTKVLIERRGLKKPAALALLVGPAIVVALGLAWFGAARSPLPRLNYLCAGHAPAARDVRLAGYSTFLREEWLAVFRTDEKAFQSFATDAKLAPADGFEFQKMFAASSLQTTRLGKILPPLPADARFFQRVFKPEEHERGRIFAAFDAATQTALVLREYRD